MNTYECSELADKIYSELSWIASGSTSLDMILALSILIGRYGDDSNAALIGKELFETVRDEEYNRAKRDFDEKLKKVMDIK